MTTIEDLARMLSVSVRGVRLRVDALSSTVAPFIRQGPNNRSLFTGAAVGMLRRLEEVRQTQGVSIRGAASIVRREEEERREQSDNAAQVKGRDNLATSEACKELVRAKNETIELLRVQVAELRAQVERLLPLALPRPRRGLLARLRRRGD